MFYRYSDSCNCAKREVYYNLEWKLQITGQSMFAQFSSLPTDGAAARPLDNHHHPPCCVPMSKCKCVPRTVRRRRFIPRKVSRARFSRFLDENGQVPVMAASGGASARGVPFVTNMSSAASYVQPRKLFWLCSFWSLECAPRFFGVPRGTGARGSA